MSELLEIPFEHCTLWTDSKDIIFWIQGQSRRYKTFVANRVSEIRQTSSLRQCRHVPSNLICADDSNRGLHAKVLTREHLWFSGPEFLYEHEDYWPQGKCIVYEESSEECVPEIVKPKMTFALEVSKRLMNPLKYSSWNRLRKVAAWVRRFADTLLGRVKKRGKPLGVVTGGGLMLTPGEIDRGGKLWVKQAQEERFPEGMKDLIRGKEVKRQGHLKSLAPIVDELGVLRVGGRLDRAELPYDAANPMILPKKHHITQLIVADVQNRSRHAGVNHVLAQVLSRYWVIDGRQEVRNWDKERKVCDRRRAQPAVQIIVPLSKSRLGTKMRAFAKCCVDYAGFFTTKITRRVSANRYLCLFTCSATRAVHLEMACSLSATNGGHQGKTGRSCKR